MLNSSFLFVVLFVLISSFSITVYYPERPLEESHQKELINKVREELASIQGITFYGGELDIFKVKDQNLLYYFLIQEKIEVEGEPYRGIGGVFRTVDGKVVDLDILFITSRFSIDTSQKVLSERFNDLVVDHLVDKSSNVWTAWDSF